MRGAIWLELVSVAAACTFAAACQPTTIIRRSIVSGPYGIRCTPATCGDPASVVSITYLGISGILVEHGGHVLLADPFFSNPAATRGPGALRWLVSGPRISSDSAVIERLLPISADRASVILVGHGHYDHLMDVPYIATHRARSAVIFGGPSIRHMLIGDETLRANAGRLATIPLESAGDLSRDGDWFYSPDSAFRFMALKAGHAPNVKLGSWGFTFAEARVSADMDSLPHMAAEWKLGEPYAFLIDVLSDSTRTTLFRIYFEDAPSEPPLGTPSASIVAKRTVDLAILCAATSSHVNAAPEKLLQILQPRAVMVTHWESFFRSRLTPTALSHATDLRRFSRSLRRSLAPEAGWIMPIPQATIRFRVSGPLIL